VGSRGAMRRGDHLVFLSVNCVLGCGFSLVVGRKTHKVTASLTTTCGRGKGSRFGLVVCCLCRVKTGSDGL
jgi:hypothetical protein